MKTVIVCVHSNGTPMEKYDPSDANQLPLANCTCGGVIQNHEQTAFFPFSNNSLVAIRVEDPTKPVEGEVVVHSDVNEPNWQSKSKQYPFSINHTPGSKRPHEVRADGTITEYVAVPM